MCVDGGDERRPRTAPQARRAGTALRINTHSPGFDVITPSGGGGGRRMQRGRRQEEILGGRIEIAARISDCE